MRRPQSAPRRAALFPLLAASWTALSLLSAGCVDDAKRPSRAGAAGMGGRVGAGGSSGAGSAAAGAGVDEEAGASGSLADAGTIGEGGARAEVGPEAGAGGGAEAGAGADAGAGGDSSGTQTGSAGAGGEIDTFSEPCPSSALDGWASVAGLTFDPALTQPTPLEVSVSNATDLATYAASPDPYLIHVSGTIVLPVLDVKSNKTIIGDGRGATLEGGIRIAGTSTAPADMVSNVVIRNLHINAKTSTTVPPLPDPPPVPAPDIDTDSDGITIAYAHHVWIDHVQIGEAPPPGNSIDITNGSDYVSISWTKFQFAVVAQSNTGVRIGHSDGNAAEDSGRLKVTLHHNFWTDSMDQRMPRVRFGDVHVFDNYYSRLGSGQNSYCVAAALNSRLLVENNYFDQVQRPHVFFSYSGMAAYTEPSAQMVATGNTYVGISDDPSGKQSGQGSAFTPPYSVVLEPADTRLKDFVRHCTGPQ